MKIKINLKTLKLDRFLDLKVYSKKDWDNFFVVARIINLRNQIYSNKLKKLLNHGRKIVIAKESLIKIYPNVKKIFKI